MCACPWMADSVHGAGRKLACCVARLRLRHRRSLCMRRTACRQADGRHCACLVCALLIASRSAPQQQSHATQACARRQSSAGLLRQPRAGGHPCPKQGQLPGLRHAHSQRQACLQAGAQEQSGGALRQRPNPVPTCELTSICRMLQRLDEDAHPGSPRTLARHVRFALAGGAAQLRQHALNHLPSGSGLRLSLCRSPPPNLKAWGWKGGGAHARPRGPAAAHLPHRGLRDGWPGLQGWWTW